MTIPTINGCYKLFSSAENSDIAILIAEARALVLHRPEILTRIEADQVQHGILKKIDRIKYDYWVNDSQGVPLLYRKAPIINTDHLILEQGRPRMPGFLVLVFILIRGRFGGIKHATVRTLLAESESLSVLYCTLGVTRPGLSTIVENINTVSLANRNYVMNEHLMMMRSENLDNFLSLTTDSTHVNGNTAFPTDSSLIMMLCQRLIRDLSNIAKTLGAKDIADKYAALIKKIKTLSKFIAFDCGKPGSKTRQKKSYQSLTVAAEKFFKKAEVDIFNLRQCEEKLDVAPAIKSRLQKMLTCSQEDNNNIVKVICYTLLRVIDGKQTPSVEKLLSLSDGDAAFIKKGGREAVIGYKPQFGRSENGFISAFILPDGNAADSEQVIPMVKNAIERVAVTPKTVSFDDGYSSAANYKELTTGFDNKIEIVSFSGAKGKKITPDELYESDVYQKVRDDRSAVESIMFTIKFSFNMDRVCRRGLENVRCEALEKIIAYNMLRGARLRQDLENCALAKTLNSDEQKAA